LGLISDFGRNRSIFGIHSQFFPQGTAAFFILVGCYEIGMDSNSGASYLELFSIG